MSRGTPSSPRLRCAIYTRKSSEEGLEQDFNSLHAQREACEAYVKSQSGEGWTAVAAQYDDGGYSGGSMDRPGLHHLLRDIEAGRVDVVVVYKVDRLTRSLTDFAKIVERFDAQGVSFVSVTQAFNTTSSMGRLTLNVLLSFAQFEREVTGERIRDKIAASKAKGMWMGGNLPLGYDAPAQGAARALVVNQVEAHVVRHIFSRYLALRSMRVLRDELEREGIRSKRWVSSRGREIGGAVFSRGALRHLLKNPTYIGLIPHRDRTQPGLHPPIVSPDDWERAQQLLAANSRWRRREEAQEGWLLAGLILDATGAPMSPTTAQGRSKKRYRYYVSAPLQQGRRAPADGVVRRIAAAALEELIEGRLRRLIGLELRDIRSLLSCVRLLSERIEIDMNADTLLPDAADLERLRTKLEPADDLRFDGDVLRLTIETRPVFRGGRTWLVQGPMAASGKADPHPALIKALKAAHRWQLSMNASPMTSPADLSEAEAAADSYIRRLAPFAFLAPDIQRAILDGRQPAGLNLQNLLTRKLPLAWEDQRALLLAPD